MVHIAGSPCTCGPTDDYVSVSCRADLNDGGSSASDLEDLRGRLAAGERADGTGSNRDTFRSVDSPRSVHWNRRGTSVRRASASRAQRWTDVQRHKRRVHKPHCPIAPPVQGWQPSLQLERRSVRGSLAGIHQHSAGGSCRTFRRFIAIGQNPLGGRDCIHRIMTISNTALPHPPCRLAAKALPTAMQPST